MVIGVLITLFVPRLFRADAGVGACCLVLEVCRDGEHVQTVNAEKLLFFGQSSTGHARQFFIHAEVILDGDGRMGNIFRLHLHAFFGFHRLMEPIGPTPPRHHTSGEFVHDDDLTVLNDIFFVAAE